MRNVNQPRFIVVTIRKSTIINFIIIDILFSTTLYVVVKMIYSSVIIATSGSLIGTEGVKKLGRVMARGGYFTR